MSNKINNSFTDKEIDEQELVDKNDHGPVPQEKGGDQETRETNVWIFWAFGAAFFFTICNEGIAETTQKVGPLCIFYFSTGSLATSIIFHLVSSARNYRANGVFWNDHRLIIGGKIINQNVLGYICYCALYFLVQNMAFLSMYFSARAGLNPGVIITIWSVNPLYMAVMDYFLFKQ